MLISVIIPTLNRPAYLIDAIRSILSGIYQHFEILIVDQTPDSSTRDALAGYLADRRLRYISASSPGASAARNLGVISSSGEVIVFTDDDIVARPNWLELIVRELSADSDLQFISGSLTAPAYNRALGFVPEFQPDPMVMARRLPLVVSNANISMRRRLFDQIGGYDEFCGPGGLLKSSDDGDITLRVVRSGAKWKVCPEIEVVHLHGFRPHAAADRLLDDYAYGNGGIYGRALRRGDLHSGGWFLLRELSWAAKRLLPGQWGSISDKRALLRLRGFWQGFCLPPKAGFIDTRQSPPEILQERLVGEDASNCRL